MGDILGVRVTPQGDTINSFIIDANSGVQTYPAVVFNGTDYITVWSDCQLGRYYINTTRITPAGNIPGPYYWIGAAGAQDEDCPDIAYNGVHCLSVWSEEYAGVKGRFISNSGAPEDSVITIAPFTITSYTAPALASDGSDFLVVWYERTGAGDWDILGQLVSSQGTLIGTQITIAAGVNSQYDADIVFDGVNYFVVYRETNNYIYGRRVDVNGNLVGLSIPVSEQSGIYRYQPTLVNSPDNYLIVWSEWRGAYFDVYGNVDIVPIGVNESMADPLIRYAVIAPTPVHGYCKLLYGITRETSTRISLYDACGRCIQSMHEVMRKPGTYSHDIPTRLLVNGVYFVRIDTDAGGVTRKMTLIE